MNAQLIFFIGVVQSVMFIVHFAVYKAFVFFGDIHGRALEITKLSFIVLSVFFVIGSIITSSGFSSFGKAIYTLSAVWLGVLLWLFLASIIGIIGWWLMQYTQYPAATTAGFKHVYGSALLILVIIINTYGLIHATNIKVTNYEVKLPNLPIEWDGKQIVMFADSHFGNIWNVKRAKKITTVINELKPDAVLIAGDFYDGPSINFDEVTAPFATINSKYGTFFATGNHEEYRDKKIYIDTLEKNKITVLQNSFKNLDGLIIAGINYGDSKEEVTQANIIATMLDVDRPLDSPILDEPVILIKHVPDVLEGAKKVGVNLQVSGHTHSGQMWPFSLVTKLIYGKYYYGLNNFGDMQVLTTSGAGSWGPPQRIGTDSEIVNIKLIRE